MISCCFLPVVHAPLHDSHRFSCVKLHSPGTSRGKRAPGISFSVKETVLIAELPKVFDDSLPDAIVILTVYLPKRFAQVFMAILMPGLNSFLEWAIEEMLSGKGTSHRVNGIAVQPRVFGPDLPPKDRPRIDKRKERTLSTEHQPQLDVYVAGPRVGPHLLKTKDDYAARSTTQSCEQSCEKCRAEKHAMDPC